MLNLPHEVVFASGSASSANVSVSVVISLYNYEKFIVECMTSIERQTLTDIELVVVDDRSTDESVAVTHEWLVDHTARFAGLRLIRNCSNYGLSASRNIGIAAASSDLVFVMDADNVIFPRALQKLKAVMDVDDCDAAYSQLLLFGDERKAGYADFWSKDFLRKGPYIDAMALIRKEAWQKVGRYSHIEGGWEDYDFWCKFAEKCLTAVYLPEILCKYRVHSSSMLRADTAKRYSRIKNIMSLRHPWLDLE